MAVLYKSARMSRQKLPSSESRILANCVTLLSCSQGTELCRASLAILSTVHGHVCRADRVITSSAPTSRNAPGWPRQAPATAPRAAFKSSGPCHCSAVHRNCGRQTSQPRPPVCSRSVQEVRFQWPRACYVWVTWQLA